MIIGCPKEIKTHEYRVGLTPSCVAAYVQHGHTVMLESQAGLATGFSDDVYRAAGAEIVEDKARLFERADMIVKVKEPLPGEYDLFREGQLVYTYLHLAANEELTRAMMARKIRAVAYETIEDDHGGLPCLRPMSEIAGRLSIQEGAKYLEKPFGGLGILLGGIPGVQRGRVGILGGGVVGINACKMAVGLGADVTVLEVSQDRMAYLDDVFSSHITTLYSQPANIERVLRESDLIIGAVLVPGAVAPKLVRREHLAMMKPGAVVVDVAIDQGGCFETSRPTNHDAPIYKQDGIVHYCVTNMPGAVSLTSTIGLTSVTLRYGLMIADMGLEGACKASPSFARGVNLYRGHCVYRHVAKAFGMTATPLDEVLSA